MPPDIAEKMLAQRPGDPESGASFAVLPENWPAVKLFLACGTQWRTAGMAGVVIGLDYSAVAVVASARRTKLTARLLDDLQVMEAAVVKALSDRR